MAWKKKKHSRQPELRGSETKAGLERFSLAVAFFIGAVGTVGLKLIGAPILAVALYPVAVLLGYVLVSYLDATLGIEPETIGDNCYYLGFLFTLTSLAVTLYQIREFYGASAEEAGFVAPVISGFGVALTSTIAGVFLRVLLMQMRPDLVARDREARRDLAQGAREFRSSVAAASRDIKSIAVETSQHAAEREAKIAGITDEHVKQVNDLMSRQSEAFETTAKDFATRLTEELSAKITGEVTESVRMLQHACDEVADSLRTVSELHRAEEKELREANATLRSSKSEFATAMAEHRKAVETAYKGLATRTGKLQESLDASVEKLDHGAAKTAEALGRREEALDAQTQAIVERGGTVLEAFDDLKATLRERADTVAQHSPTDNARDATETAPVAAEASVPLAAESRGVPGLRWFR